ncbi:MAG TPA: AI-2E family transporter [Acidimicrobiales bacterium]|nr:AI-2E family transporter [Acidimicrobiales bacterium]
MPPNGQSSPQAGVPAVETVGTGWRDLPGPVLRTAAEYAWRLTVVGFVFYFAVGLMGRLALVVVPFLVSLLVTALLRPVHSFFVRHGAGRGMATLATVLGSFILVGGLIALVVIRAAEQAPQLGNEINSLIPHVKHWLIHGPFHLNPKSVNNISTTISQDISKNSSKIASTALSTTRSVLDVLGGFFLVVFSTIFLLYDGERVWRFTTRAVPASLRERVDMGGRAAWVTLSHYVRGTLVVAAFHGLVMAITLSLLGVPLAFPLAVVIGLGSFVPLVGAIVTGILAVGVAGLSKGLVAAVIVVAVLLLDGQIEGHILQPFVVGRYVRVHPLAVVLALGAGGLLFGIFGAIIAVPIVACLNSATRALAPPEGEAAAAAGPPSPGVAGAGPQPEGHQPEGRGEIPPAGG